MFVLKLLNTRWEVFWPTWKGKLLGFVFALDFLCFLLGSGGVLEGLARFFE